MDSKQRITQRPRRPRTVPPSGPTPSSAPPYFRSDEEVPRFTGMSAPLASLAVQVRSAKTKEEKASAAGRLARQLVRRGIETREAIGLAEKSLSLHPEPELALDLASWWVSAGDLIRGAALRHAAVDGLSGARKVEELLAAARVYARAGQAAQATQALRQAVDLDSQDARSWEMQGALGFWSEAPDSDCGRYYLKAAELRRESGEEGLAFENILRAFEVAPHSSAAAELLASTLRQRGRPGAADEILREHLRHGSAAQRAAHHQRSFYAAVVEKKDAAALESALEAELDVELDPDRLENFLASPPDQASDFEGLLIRLSKTAALGEEGPFVQWLLALLNVHIFDWGAERVSTLRDRALVQLEVPNPTRTQLPGDLMDPAVLRSLRKKITEDPDPGTNRAAREEVAQREAACGHWAEAYEVLQPLLTGVALSLPIAVLATVVASRARKPLGRARALRVLGRLLPSKAAAVLQAVAAEMLLKEGAPREARDAAAAAIEADPRSERALASQALVALGAPETASSGLIERSLSVLVARAEACSLLCRSAADSGSPRLGLSWAARGLALRPGDLRATREYLAVACATEDTEKILEALRGVLEQAAPLAPLLEDIAQTLRALSTLSREEVETIGVELIGTVGIRATPVTEALVELAKTRDASMLLATITERQLVTAKASERAGLSLVLCRRRLRAEQFDAAARALRRALAQGADLSLVRESVENFDVAPKGDGQLAMLEIEAELLEKGEPDYTRKRADGLRRVAAARFDMAQDTGGAVQFLLKAADLEGERGDELFAHYLHHLAGPDGAVEHLKAAAQNTEDPKRSGRLLGFAARELFETDRRAEAFDLSVEALQRAPLLTELLAVAESCASSAQIDDLLDLYTLLADAALGCYGERAVHYHAARQLDERGLPIKALEHAVLAFQAVPSEGVAFVLMARLAESASQQDTLLAALQRTAETASSDEERTRWLSKAADLADPDAVGRRQRVAILMRAAQMTPDEKSLTAYLDALSELIEEEPGAQDELWERFRGVATEVLRHASGAYGAQLSVVLAEAAVKLFNQADFAISCLSHAVDSDIEIPEYEQLLPLATVMAGVKEPTIKFVSQVREVSDRREAPLGGGLAKLAGRLAELVDVRSQKSELLVRAASDFPEDSELVSMARIEARHEGREDLLQEIEGLLPVAEQVQSVLERLGSLGRREGLDALLTLDLNAVSDDKRAELLELIGERQEEMGELDHAALTYRELFELRPNSRVAVGGVERAAERQGNHEEVARLLKIRSEQVPDAGTARRLILRRATVLETKLGRAAEARATLAALVEKTEDRSALRMLADSWERAGDYAEAAELWMRVHSVAADTVESDDACYRAASCFLEAGAPRSAGEALDKIVNPSIIHRKLALQVARALGKKEGILKQLVALAHVMVGDGVQAGELYLEATRLALHLGDSPRARYCAMNARRLLPDSHEACLMELRLQFQKERPANSEAAKKLLSELEGARSLSLAVDREICEYLRSQATILADSKEAAMRLLEEAVDDQGPRPLLSLALADLCGADDERAMSLFESAVGADLHGFFGEGEVLLRAGRVARKLGDFDTARGFLSAVAEGDPSRAEASTEQAEIDAEEEAQLAEGRAKAAEEERRLQQEAEQEAARRALEEEAAQKEAEAEAARKAAEEEEARKAAEAERLARETAEREEAERRAAEEAEAAKRLAEEEAARKAAELDAVRRAAAEEAAAERRLAAERAARDEAERIAAEEKARAEYLEREAQGAASRRLAAERASAKALARQEAAEQADRRAAEERAAVALAQEEAQRLAAQAKAREAMEAEEAQRLEEERQLLLGRARAAASRRPPVQQEEADQEAERHRIAEQASRRAAAEAAARQEGNWEAVERAQAEAKASREGESLEARGRTLKKAREEHRRESLAASDSEELAPAPRQAIVSSPPGASGNQVLGEEIAQLIVARVPVIRGEDDVPIDLVRSERHPQGSHSDHEEEELVVPAAESVDEFGTVPPSDPAFEEDPVVTPSGQTSPISRHPPQTDRADHFLVELLERGDVEAGLELLDRVQGDRARVGEALLVAQHLVALEPGDASILGRLVTTASRDGNHALALAIQHILGAYGAGDEKLAPSLSRLRSQGVAVGGLLKQAATSKIHEVVALVWEHASPHYKREIADYGVSGVERVPHSATTPFGILAREAGRVLGMGRTAVFRQVREGDIGMQVALLTPPAVIVTGDVEMQSSEIGFHFGAMLAAAAPEHALLFGALPEELETLFGALSLCFGQGHNEAGSRPSPEITRVASFLWESIPTRAQRRLSQLCSEPELLDLEKVTASSRRMLRRAGLIVCGDLPTAINDACGEVGLESPTNLSELADRARRSSAVADLVSLAVSPEYAEIRFREG